MIVTLQPESWKFSLTWDTIIIKADDGSEQRNTNVDFIIPRLDVDAEFLPDEAFLRELRLALFKSPAASHEIVLWHREAIVQGNTGAGTILVKDVDVDCLGEGRRLILAAPDEDPLVFEVIGVGLDSPGIYELSLDDDPPVALRSAGARVLPLMEVYLADNQATGRWRLGDIGRWNMAALGKTFYSTMGTGAEEIAEFDGYLLLDRATSIGDAETVAEQHQGDVMGLDDIGYVEPTTRVINGDIAREARFAWHTAADRQYWFNFLYTIAGRRRPFLTPTWREDLEPDGVVLATGDEVDVKVPPDYQEWFTANSHKRLACFFADGSFEPCKVVSIVDSGTFLTLTLEDPLTTGDPIVFFSFLEVVRSAIDKFEFSYANGQGRFEFPMVVIQDTPLVMV